MKSDIVFALENAGWPALLVNDTTSTIVWANALAVRLFKTALADGSPLLADIWSPANPSPAEQFLAQWEQSPVVPAPLKLQAPGGDLLSCQGSVCAFTQDGQKFFLLQLLPETAPAAPPPSPSRPAEPVSAPSPAPPVSAPIPSETGLIHKQKLECALQLARTVALDFNNALTSILGHTSLLLSKIEPNHPWRGALLEVEKSAARAAEIANDLGAFSRQEKETRAQSAGNLNLLAQRTVEIFQSRETGAGARPVEWKLQLERKLFAAKFDEAKLQQALVKILENAVQSLPGPGRITVQTRNLELTQPTQDRNVHLAAGAYVCVEISDNGCGIAPDVLPRVFEPFFTTKRGSHRGLGLAWVYGIITNHGGGVAISSQLDAGTSVRVYLPAEKRIVKDPGVPTDDLNGHQTILLVDDEDLLLTMGQTILSAYGYRVLTANSGQKALDILAGKEPAVDLVITDLVMPAMSGRELVEHIRRLAPAIRVLCTSGYIWPAGQENETAYLQKPFTSQELLLKVKQVLSNG